MREKQVSVGAERVGPSPVPCADPETITEHQSGEQVDVIVIGAGLGGLQSVNICLDILEETEREQEKQTWRLGNKRHVIKPPSRLKALRWLWKAPGNAGA